jgi:hypothetical protein
MPDLVWLPRDQWMKCESNECGERLPTYEALEGKPSTIVASGWTVTIIGDSLFNRTVVLCPLHGPPRKGSTLQEVVRAGVRDAFYDFFGVPPTGMTFAKVGIPGGTWEEPFAASKVIVNCDVIDPGGTLECGRPLPCSQHGKG